jgi:hypothetical protein
MTEELEDAGAVTDFGDRSRVWFDRDARFVYSLSPVSCKVTLRSLIRYWCSVVCGGVCLAAF